MILSGGRTALLGLALVPYACLSLFSCSSQEKSAAAKGVQAEAFRVLVGGDLHGYVAPCGCTKPMLGGMTRRATLVKELEKAGALVKIENGDLTEAAGRQDQLKAETIVEMLASMKYDAINAGEQEFALGLAYVRSLQERSGGRMISANVFDEAGQTILPPFAMADKTLAQTKVRVAVVGVLSGQHGDIVAGMNPGTEVRAPEAVLPTVLPSIAGCNVRILMVHGSHDEAEALAKQFPDFQIVVYAHEDESSQDTIAKAGPTMVCAGKKGRRLGIVTLASAKPHGVAGLEYRKIGPELSDEAQAVQIEKSYLDRVGDEGLLASFPRTSLKPGEAFAGSASCKSCHAEPYAIWQRTEHAHAYQTLITARHELDPECVSCHVVGLDKVGGFTDTVQTPKLSNVGCESCHGPAKQHTTNPSKFNLPSAGEAACKRCHVPEHSPGFDFQLYWKSIKH